MSLEDSGLSTVVCRVLLQHYDRVRRRVHGLVESLTEEELWQRPFRYGNSIGHLLLHLTGNLNYYIGAQIANSGYVRDRPREFADESRPPKEAVLGAFDASVELVLAALARQGAREWASPYAAIGEEDAANRLTIFLRCVAHADHHLGQMIYLCKELALSRARKG